MKRIDTTKTKSIGNGKRTVGLTPKSRVSKQRTQKRSTITASRTQTRRPTGAKSGCSGCSRNKK